MSETRGSTAESPRRSSLASRGPKAARSAQASAPSDAPPVEKLSAFSSAVEKAVSSGTQSSVAQKERASRA